MFQVEHVAAQQGPARFLSRAATSVVQSMNLNDGNVVRLSVASARDAAAPVKVRIAIDYPVDSPKKKVVTLDRRYPGEIFGLLHDFYQELYAADEKRGGTPGPADDGPILNRSKGPIVWGHDMMDLVIEGVSNKPNGVEGEFRFSIGS